MYHDCQHLTPINHHQAGFDAVTRSSAAPVLAYCPLELPLTKLRCSLGSSLDLLLVRDAKQIEDAAGKLSDSSELAPSSEGNEVQIKLGAIADRAKEGEFFYTKFFAIGLFRLLELTGRGTTVTISSHPIAVHVYMGVSDWGGVTPGCLGLHRADAVCLELVCSRLSQSQPTGQLLAFAPQGLGL